MRGTPARRLALAGLGVGVGVGVTVTSLAVHATRAWLRMRRTVLADLHHPLLLLPLNLTTRAALRVLRAGEARPSPVVPGVQVTRRVLPAREDRPPVQVYVYEPAARRRPSAALVWIHGGGFVSGHPAAYHERCSRFAAELGILVVSVDYRLAPEHPFPAGLEDCCTALAWLHAQADVLGVDAARVAIGGDSAGGGLAATLAQLAHDRGDLPVRFQLLVYPMLDDRTVLRGDHAGTGAFAWTPASNRFGWTSYLAHPPADDEPRPYAAATRRGDLAGLPPAWIGVGELDLFHAEDIAYAERLTAAGVPCELHVVPGMYHGADIIVGDRSPTVTAFRDRMTEALGRAVG